MTHIGKFLVVSWILAFALAGCGLKGDLYLPEAETPAAAAEEEEENKENSQNSNATDSLSQDNDS